MHTVYAHVHFCTRILYPVRYSAYCFADLTFPRTFQILNAHPIQIISSYSNPPCPTCSGSEWPSVISATFFVNETFLEDEAHIWLTP